MTVQTGAKLHFFTLQMYLQERSAKFQYYASLVGMFVINIVCHLLMPLDLTPLNVFYLRLLLSLQLVTSVFIWTLKAMC